MSKRRLSDSIPNFQTVQMSKALTLSTQILDIPKEVITNVLFPQVPYCYFYQLKRVNKLFYQIINDDFLKCEKIFDCVDGKKSQKNLRSTPRDTKEIFHMDFHNHEYAAIIGYIIEDDARMLGYIWKRKHLQCLEFSLSAARYSSKNVVKFFLENKQVLAPNFFNVSLNGTEDYIKLLTSRFPPKRDWDGIGLVKKGNIGLLKDLIYGGYICWDEIFRGKLINEAAFCGHAEIIQWLLPKSEITTTFFRHLIYGKKPALFKKILSGYLLFHKFHQNESELIAFLMETAKSSVIDGFNYVCEIPVSKKTFMTMETPRSLEIGHSLMDIMVDSPKTNLEMCKKIVETFGPILKPHCCRNLKLVVKHFNDSFVNPGIDHLDMWYSDVDNSVANIEYLIQENIIIVEKNASLQNYLKMFETDALSDPISDEQAELLAKLLKKNIISLGCGEDKIIDFGDRVKSLPEPGPYPSIYDRENLEMSTIAKDVINKISIVDTHLDQTRHAIELILRCTRLLEGLEDLNVFFSRLAEEAPNTFTQIVGILNFLRSLWGTNSQKFLDRIDRETYKNVSEKIFGIFPKFRANFLFGQCPIEYDDLTAIKEYYKRSDFTSHLCKELEYPEKNRETFKSLDVAVKRELSFAGNTFVNFDKVIFFCSDMDKPMLI